MLGYFQIPTIQLSLGKFQFGIFAAAYQELVREVEYRWPTQDRFGQKPVAQYVGPGNETIRIPGVIYPEYRGGLSQIDDMRKLAGKGLPQTLIDGRGNVLGKWAIERIEERQTVFAAFGVPRKQEFTLTLKHVEDMTVTGNLPAALIAALSLAAAAASGQSVLNTANLAKGALAGGVNTALGRLGGV